MDLERHDSDPGPGIRASDAERDRVGSLLNQHYADGRLTLDEFSERMELVYEARTRGELAETLRELPALPHPVPAPSVPEPAQRRARTLAPAVAFPLAILAVLLVLGAVLSLGLVSRANDAPPLPPPPAPQQPR